MPRTGDVIEEALNGTMRKYRAMPDGSHAEVVYSETRDTAVRPPAITSQLAAVNEVFNVSCDGANILLMQFTGTFAGAGLVFELSLDSTDGVDGAWAGCQFSSALGAQTGTSMKISGDPGRIYRFTVMGATWFRVRMTALTSGAVQCICAKSWSTLDPSPNPVLAGGVAVYGYYAEDSTYTGSFSQPHLMGGKALSALPAVATTGRLKALMTTLLGALIIKPYSIPEADWQYTSPAPINTTADVATKSAVTGLRNYVTGVQVQNTGTVATDIVIKDGAAVIFRLPLAANMATPVVVTFPTPLRASVGAAINAACATAGASVYVNAQGYTAT